MLVKDVFIKYHKKVPFPWSIKKIKKAGFSPTKLLLELVREIDQCTDGKTEATQSLISLMNDMGMFE